MPELTLDEFREIVARPINVQKNILRSYVNSPKEKLDAQTRFNSNIVLDMIGIIHNRVVDHDDQLLKELSVLVNFIVLVNSGKDDDKLEIISHRLKRPVSNDYISGLLQVLSEEIV